MTSLDFLWVNLRCSIYRSDQFLFSSHEELEGSHLPLRPPPGLSHSFRSQLTTNDNMTDWLRLLLEADDARGEAKGQVLALQHRSLEMQELQDNQVNKLPCSLWARSLTSPCLDCLHRFHHTAVFLLDFVSDDQQVPVFSDQLLWNPY